MSNTLENVIWYSIGAFDYLIEREYHKGPSNLFKNSSTDRENILSNEDVNNINKHLKSFGYSEEELSNKRSEIKKNIQGRHIYQVHNDIDKKSVKHIINLYESGGCNSLNDFVSDISRNIEDKSVVLNKNVLNKTLIDLC